MIQIHWRTQHEKAHTHTHTPRPLKGCAKAVPCRSYNVTQQNHHDDHANPPLLSTVLQSLADSFKKKTHLPSLSFKILPRTLTRPSGTRVYSACALDCSACACRLALYIASYTVLNLWTWRPKPPRIWIYRLASGETAILEKRMVRRSEWCVFS